MRNTFPGGVYDDRKSTAFVGVPGGDLVAVDLRSGDVLWRKPAGGKPIAANREHILAEARETPGRLRLLDRESGSPVAEFDLTEGEAGLRGMAVEVIDAQLGEEAGRATISLIGEPHYSGGASPPRWVTKSGPMRFDLAVDRDSGRVERLEGRSADRLDDDGFDPGSPDGSGDEPADRRVELKEELRPGGPELVLQGRDSAGRVTWTTPLGKMTRKGPRPPRP